MWFYFLYTFIVKGWQLDIQAAMFLRFLIRRYTTGFFYCVFLGLGTLWIQRYNGLPVSVGVWRRLDDWASTRAATKGRNSALEYNSMAFAACLENHASCNQEGHWLCKDAFLHCVSRNKITWPLKQLVLPQIFVQTEICIDSQQLFFTQ